MSDRGVRIGGVAVRIAARWTFVATTFVAGFCGRQGVAGEDARVADLGAMIPAPTRAPLSRSVDLDLGEGREVTLADGRVVRVRLVATRDARDAWRDAVRSAEVDVEIDGRSVTLASANYALPREIGAVRIDCPVTRALYRNTNRDAWGLRKEARLRLWPAGSPLMTPGTFGYPLRARWFASGTQMANEPCFVDAGERADRRQIYYHNGLDFGGCEAMDAVVAATDGTVVSSAGAVLAGYEGSPARARGDVVYVRDALGWYYRYSHLHTIAEGIVPGARVRLGQRIGLLGKEGASGGWAHLHFDIQSPQPSGEWGTEEAYAFVWEAYVRERGARLLAVARPHHLAVVGEEVTLDSGRSWSACGRIARCEWALGDGTAVSAPTARRIYRVPGTYSEVLKIVDGEGNVGWDFATVQVADLRHPEWVIPSIQAAYAPSVGIGAGQRVTFKVRTFGTTHGEECWDFGDGTPRVRVRSDGCVKALAKDGFAVTDHAFARAGEYIVRVERENERGERAVAHLHVSVGE